MNRMNTRNSERGAISGSIFAIVTLTILTVAFAGFSVWAYIQYNEQKTDVDAKITAATAEAVKENTEKLESDFLEREKQPLRQFVGPDDYGRLTFDYPRTWSAYQATDIREGGGVTYEAFLNPVFVPPTKPKDIKMALRITIKQEVYDEAMKVYEKLLKNGSISSAAWSNEKGLTGTRLTGNFTPDIRGTAVVVKMRDRTLTVRTDADVFLPDYENIIKTLNFNQ